MTTPILVGVSSESGTTGNSGGYLKVGITPGGMVIVADIPKACEWIEFSPKEARQLARLLNKKAKEIDNQKK